MSRPFLSSVVGALACAAALCGRPVSAGEGPRSGQEVDVVDCRVLFVERRTLSSERSGILCFVVKEGDHVETGESVVRIEDSVPQSALAVAEARAASDVDVRVAKKESEAAHAEHRVALQANRNAPGTYPDTEILRLQLTAEAADLKVEQAEHELEVNCLLRDQAQAELETYDVGAPLSGLVTRTFKGAGEGVQLAEPILELINTDTVRVEGFVSVRDASRIRPGMQVTAHVDPRGDVPSSRAPQTEPRTEVKPFDGRLGFVDVSVQPVTRVVRVWAEVANRDGQLRDGLTARMTIHIADSVPTAGK